MYIYYNKMTSKNIFKTAHISHIDNNLSVQGLINYFDETGEYKRTSEKNDVLIHALKHGNLGFCEYKDPEEKHFAIRNFNIMRNYIMQLEEQNRQLYKRLNKAEKRYHAAEEK